MWAEQPSRLGVDLLVVGMAVDTPVMGEREERRDRSRERLIVGEREEQWADYSK